MFLHYVDDALWLSPKSAESDKFIQDLRDANVKVTDYKGVDKVYPEDVNALRKVGLAPLDFPTMGDVWSNQDEKVDT